jgi:uncharacterized delta-60 repeat protein
MEKEQGMSSKGETKQWNLGSFLKTVWMRSKFWRVPVFPAVIVLALSSAARAADGDLDPSFGAGGKTTVQIAAQQRDFITALAVQQDGKIIVGGELGEFSGNTNSSILARLNPNGTLDPSFGNGGKVTNSAQLHLPGMVLQPDGKIVTAAATASGAFATNLAAVRYNFDGSLDQTFGSGGFAVNGAGNAHALVRQPDGKIIVVGDLPIYRNGSDFLLARFNVDGSPDQTFGTGSRVTTSFTAGRDSADVALSAALQADGKIVVSGYTSCIEVALVRYNTDGSIDNTFGLDGAVLTPNFGATATRVAIQADGKIVIGGGGFVVGRYNPDGRIDRGFGANGKISGGFGTGNGSLHALAFDQSGRILAAGSISYTGTGNCVFALSRYTTAGLPDTTFGNNGFVLTSFTGCLDEANALAIQPDSRLVLGGYAAEPGCSYHDFALARYIAGPRRITPH